MPAAAPITLDPRRFSIRLPRPLWLFVATLVMVVAKIHCEPVAAHQDLEPSAVHTVRRKNLVEALQVPFGDGPVAERAAQHLAVLPPHEPLSSAVVATIVKRSNLGRGDERRVDDFVHPAFVAAIAAQGKFAVPELVRTLQTQDLSDAAYLTVISSLGRMGPTAADARAVLREKLSAASTPVRFKASLRAVLANTGEWTEDIAQRIDKDLALETAADKSDWLNRGYYLSVMSRIYPRGNWLDAGVVGRFIAILRDPGFIKVSEYSDDFREAVIILCLAELDEKTRGSIVESLETALDLAFEGESISAIEIALALSRLRPQRSRAVLTQLFRRLPTLKPQGHVGAFLLTQSDTAYLVFNDEIAKVLAELVSSDDADIVQRVTLFFVFPGLGARTAVPMVLDFIKNNADEARRSDAAGILEFIADFSVVEKIESAAKAEGSSKMSEGLRRAVKSLRQFE